MAKSLEMSFVEVGGWALRTRAGQSRSAQNGIGRLQLRPAYGGCGGCKHRDSASLFVLDP